MLAWKERCTIKETRNGVTFEASVITSTRHDLGTGKKNVGRMQCTIKKKNFLMRIAFPENNVRMAKNPTLEQDWLSINSNQVYILQEFQ